MSWEVRMGNLKGLVEIVRLAVVSEGGGGSVRSDGWWLDGWWLLFVYSWCCDGAECRVVVFESSNISRRFYRCILQNSCLPCLVAIDLIENVGKDFVLGGWRRNEFEFVRLLVEEGKLSVGLGDWVYEQGGG